MNKLWLRISSAFFILITLLAIVLWFILASIIQSNYKEVLEQQLRENNALVIAFLSQHDYYDDPEDLRNFFNSSYISDDIRITYIDTDGTVIADSSHDFEDLDNHRNRPEVRAILDSNQNISIIERLSNTENQHRYYLAQPLIINDEIQGIVRTSVSFKVMQDTLDEFWASFNFVLFGLLLLTVTAATLITRNITKPINSIIAFTQQLRNQNYNSRVQVNAHGEIKSLAHSVNTLASSLYNQMKEIEENEEELISIMSNMVSGVMLVNQSGKIMLINASMSKFLNINPEYLTGKDFYAIGKHTNLVHLIERVIKENKKIHDEIQIYIPDEHILDAHLGPYYGRGWRKRGVIIVLHDITNIKRLEQVRSDFVANVSHELKTPVTSVKGFAETLLENDLPDPETTRYFIKIIYDESERLHRLIEDLLQLSEIEKHELPLHHDRLDLVQIIHQTAETLQKPINKKRIDLQIPSINHSVEFVGDIDRVKQIVLNLMANAITYTNDGGVIKVNAKLDEDQVIFTVQDDGIGIPKESLPRIFERFYRVDKARSRHSGGTGLGLAIVKHLVETHKGNIQVDSVESVGTTFTVYLPRTQESPR